MDKIFLRKKYKEIRKEIKDKNLKSRIITNKIITSEVYNNSKVIALYSSLPEEVNTLYLIEKCLKDGKVVVLPRVLNENNMEFYKIDSLKDLDNTGSFGIKEPPTNNLIKLDYIDLIIIPGICFDIKCNRLGFGKGYYDKYLNNSNIYKIGICFEEQLLLNSVIETNEYDIKMDMVITNNHIIKNNKKFIKIKK